MVNLLGFKLGSFGKWLVHVSSMLDNGDENGEQNGFSGAFTRVNGGSTVLCF